jgi:hypothetical protein
VNEVVEYGKKLEALGQMVQNPDTRLQDLVAAGVSLGLIVRVWVEPDPEQSLTVENLEP